MDNREVVGKGLTDIISNQKMVIDRLRELIGLIVFSVGGEVKLPKEITSLVRPMTIMMWTDPETGVTTIRIKEDTNGERPN